jgi:hypothetical protein
VAGHYKGQLACGFVLDLSGTKRRIMIAALNPPKGSHQISVRAVVPGSPNRERHLPGRDAERSEAPF